MVGCVLGFVRHHVHHYVGCPEQLMITVFQETKFSHSRSPGAKQNLPSCAAFCFSFGLRRCSFLSFFWSCCCCCFCVLSVWVCVWVWFLSQFPSQFLLCHVRRFFFPHATSKNASRVARVICDATSGAPGCGAFIGPQRNALINSRNTFWNEVLHSSSFLLALQCMLV